MRVVAALLERDGRVLVQRRPAKGPRGNLWEFPGGKREAGESDQAALERECREELGVSVTVGARAWETEHAYPDLVVSLALFHCELLGGEPTANDGQTIEWATRASLPERPFCEADLPVVQLLARGELEVNASPTGRPSRFRVGAYGLLIEDSRLLVTRTRTRSRILNNFPGGALELGEGALQALGREFIEETGLIIRPLGLLHASEGYHRSADYPENQLVKLYWRVERAGGELRLAGNGDDVVGCFWAPLSELHSIGLTDSDEEAIRRLRELGAL